MAPFDVFIRTIWHRYNQRFSLFMKLSIIATALQILTAFVPTWIVDGVSSNSWPVWSSMTWTMLVAIWFVGVVISIWGSLGLYFAIARPEETPTWTVALRRGGSFFWASFTTGIILSLILIAGFILLILPGIYFAIQFGLAGFLVFKEGVRNWTALQRSAQLVRGYWWAVFWRIFGLTLLYAIATSVVTQSIYSLTTYLGATGDLLIGGVLSGVVTVLAMPLTVLGYAVVYDDLVRISTTTTAPSASSAA